MRIIFYNCKESGMGRGNFTYSFHVVTGELANDGRFGIAFHYVSHLVAVDGYGWLDLSSITSLLFKFLSELELDRGRLELHDMNPIL